MTRLVLFAHLNQELSSSKIEYSIEIMEEWADKGKRVIVRARFEFENLEVKCVVDIDALETRLLGNIHSIRNYVYNCLANIVDIQAFIEERAINVYVYKIVFEDGEETIYHDGIPGLNHYIKHYKLSFEKIASLQNPYVRHVLAGLRKSILDAEQTPSHCYRVIELIRNYFIEQGHKEERGWSYLRKALSIDRSLINSFKDLATESRHGELKTRLSEEQLGFILGITWTIAGRFFAYLLNDSEVFSTLKSDDVLRVGKHGY